MVLHLRKNLYKLIGVCGEVKAFKTRRYCLKNSLLLQDSSNISFLKSAIREVYKKWLYLWHLKCSCSETRLWQ